MNAASVGRPVHVASLSEEDVQLSILCILRALAALHGSKDGKGKGLVHRDIRWKNIVQCAHLAQGTSTWILYFKVIDLETVTREGQVWQWAGTISSLSLLDAKCSVCLRSGLNLY